MYSTQITYELEGKKRPNKPDRALLDVLGLAAEDALGPGARVVVYSGKEDEGNQHGSNRHQTGLAGDVRVYKPNGKLLRLADPAAERFMLAAASRGAKGVGAGAEYMGDAFHIDLVPHENYTSGQGPVWGSFAKRRRSALVDAMSGAPVVIASAAGSDVALGSSDDDTLGFSPEQEASIYSAFINGSMTPEQAAQYRADVRDGRLGVPAGSALSDPYGLSQEDEVSIFEAYQSGQMTEDQVNQYLGDVREGLIAMPGQSVPSVPRVDIMAPDQTPETTMAGSGLDITQEMAQPGIDLTRRAASSLIGGKPFGSELIPESVPIMREGGAEINLSPGVRQVAGKALDVAMIPAGAAATAYGAAAGLAGDAAEAIGLPRPKKLAEDLMAMPEAFAGTPGILSRASRLPSYVQRTDPLTPKPSQVMDDAARAAAGMDELQDGAAAYTPEDASASRKLMQRAVAGNRKAREELADRAKPDPEAIASASRIGMDVPPDVFSDDVIVQRIRGALRSVVGSEDEAEWTTTFRRAQEQAQAVMEGQGSSLDIAVTSENIKRNLLNSIDTLRNDASRVFDEVNPPRGSKAIPTKTREILDDLKSQYGDLKSLPPIVRNLEDATKGELTYDRIGLEKRLVGKAVFEKSGPYADADDRTLTALYKALSEDQQGFVAATLGDESVEKLKAGNRLWSEAKDLQKSLEAGFGKDAEGSIASKLRLAISSGSRGDVKALNQVLSIIPDNMRRDAVLAGLESWVVKPGQGFSFAEYSKQYSGLRRNTPVFSLISKEIGPEATQALQDLYVVSAKMKRASDQIIQTGKSNQVLTDLVGDELLTKFLNSTSGHYVRTAVGGGVGAAVGTATGSPGAAMVLSGLTAAVAGAGKIGRERAKSVSALFKSSQFQKMMTEAAMGRLSDASIKAVQKSQSFRRWARAAGIENPEVWLLSAIAGTQATQVTNQAEE